MEPSTRAVRALLAVAGLSGFAASQTCWSSPPGGPVPPTGSGGGQWPVVLPTAPFQLTLPVTVPLGAVAIERVRLVNLFHHYVGDLHIVLEDPTGGKHTLVHRVNFDDGTHHFGSVCQFQGHYEIVASGAALAWPSYTACPINTALAPGEYPTYFGPQGGGTGQPGAWPSGMHGIDNTALSAIPLLSGNWTLWIYDWSAFGIGSLQGFELCFDTSGSYCTPLAPGSANGCAPAIAATGQPNLAHTAPCVVTVSGVDGQRSGLVFYGVSGSQQLPWCPAAASFLCVKPPTMRMALQSSGGTAGACDGQLVLDWNAHQLAHPGALGQPWSVGSRVDLQGWFRQPSSCKASFLSEALHLLYRL